MCGGPYFNRRPMSREELVGIVEQLDRQVGFLREDRRNYAPDAAISSASEVRDRAELLEEYRDRLARLSGEAESGFISEVQS